MDTLPNQHVVVIGGSSGIGFAVAARAQAEGARVTIASSAADKVEAALARLADGAFGVVLDVRDEASVQAAFQQIGAFDHLVFTAGDWGATRAPGRVAELDLEAGADVFAVRFWGALAAIKHAQPGLSAAGSITITNGAIAHRPRPGAVLSSAMAGAIEHLTRALAVELAPVRVNCVCPGYVLTEVWDSMTPERRAKFLEGATARQPLARAATPAEVAEAYLYLLRGTFSTGQVLIVDGGMTLV